MGSRTPADHLVCYDIREAKRLRRIHRCMRAWGTPIQYSVFHCQLTGRGRKALIAELWQLIDRRVDDVRIYGMHPRGRIEFMSQSPLPEGLITTGLTLHRDENDS